MNRHLFNLLFALLGGLLIIFVILPLISVIMRATPSTFWSAFTDSEVTRAIGLTFTAAGIATGLAWITGIPLAYLLARYHFRFKRLIEAIINLPIVIPHTAAGIALLLVFGRNGLVGRWLTPLGVTFTDNLAGIVLAMLFVSLPFLVNQSQVAFSQIDTELEIAAQVDGASPWQSFWYISMPLAWKGVFSGALMMWARGISEFGAVVILAYHPKIAPVLIYERFQGFGLPAAIPATIVLILAAMLVFLVVRLLLPEQHGSG